MWVEGGLGGLVLFDLAVLLVAMAMVLREGVWHVVCAVVIVLYHVEWCDLSLVLAELLG